MSSDKKFSDLSPYHREKVYKSAHQHRAENYEVIRAMMKQLMESAASLEEKLPVEPAGVASFDFRRWTAANWMWFSNLIASRLKSK